MGPRVLLAFLTLLSAAPSIASAAGINLYWNDCSVGVTATTNRRFACNTNVGTNVMVASFDPTTGIEALIGNNLILDLQSAVSPLAQWWRFRNAGTCRLASLSANTVFSTAMCSEPWAGSGTPGILAYMENVGGDPSRARIGATVYVDISWQGPVSPGTEYYSLNIVINNAKTVGSGSCAGCLDPVCIILNEIKLVQPAGVGSPVITNPAISHYVTWQDGLINAFGCPGGSPTVNRTWGQLKGIYR